MPAPAPGHDLVFDQRVDGDAVGDPQQCLGEAHHADSLIGGKPVFREKGLQQIGRLLCADLFNETKCAALYLVLKISAGLPVPEQRMDAGRLSLAPDQMNLLPGLV